MASALRSAARPIGYNGWRNYETWAMALRLGGEGPLGRRAEELAVQAKALAEERRTKPRWLLAEWLRDWLEAQVQVGTSELQREFLHAALAHVDWDDVAEQMLGTESETAEA